MEYFSLLNIYLFATSERMSRKFKASSFRITIYWFGITCTIWEAEEEAVKMLRMRVVTKNRSKAIYPG
jgi:hypothetical protein